VNKAEFDQEMAEQRNRSRSAALVESADWIIVRPDGTRSAFVGYDHLRAEVKICRFRKVKMKEKQLFHLVFDQTPFYAESGGQAGDVGYLDDGEEKISILNTIREHGLVIHVTDKLPQEPSAIFEAVVSETKRRETAHNHTATHLLHHALRQVIGKHVEQKGSLVNADYLRFDFSHFQKMTAEEINTVERIVNQKIRQGIERKEWRDASMAQAKSMGAMALFGEKYGDTVRVIQFGESVELCGGTHVDSTSQIGLFKIISEGSIAAGIRRIEAVTGDRAEAWYQNLESKLKSVEQLLNNPQDVVKAVTSLVQERAVLQKQVEKFTRESARILKDNLMKHIRTSGSFDLICEIADGTTVDAAIIKDVSLGLRNEKENLVVIIGANIGDKPHLAVMIPDRLVREKKLHAGEIVKTAAKEFEGSGGGQPFFATAGGKNPENLRRAVDKAASIIKASMD
jgi:alanyl-tRNA synthetase